MRYSKMLLRATLQISISRSTQRRYAFGGLRQLIEAQINGGGGVSDAGDLSQIEG
jgi:hypothetical protein